MLKYVNIYFIFWIKSSYIELIAPREVANQCPLKSFKFYKTKEDATGFDKIKTGTRNTRTPWW